MILKTTDKILIKDYINAVDETDRVLWESPMGFDPINEPEGSFSLSSCSSTALFVGGIWFLALLGDEQFYSAFILLFFLITPMLISFVYQRNTYQERHKKIRGTQYLLTSKSVVFIVYHNEKIHINQLPYNNIKKILVSKSVDQVANINIVPKEKPSFCTYNYWNDQPSLYLMMFHVENIEKAAKIIHQKISD